MVRLRVTMFVDCRWVCGGCGTGFDVCLVVCFLCGVGIIYRFVL